MRKIKKSLYSQESVSKDIDEPETLAEYKKKGENQVLNPLLAVQSGLILPCIIDT